MNSRRYWKNRLPFLLTNFVCMAALTVFLLVCGNSVSAVVLILIVWALILLSGLVLTYWKRKRQMEKLLDMAKQLSERYLISEVMELPEQAEDQVYYQLLKMAGKSMLEQIGEVERERLEYKEYIEQWIHEIKTPITAMKLLCENHRTDWTKELLLELEKTNRFTEQALYYARSEFWNTCILTFPQLIGQFLLASPAAWAFSRFTFRGRNLLFTIYTILMLLPFQVLMVPDYLVLDRLGLMDTVWSIILPGAVSTFPVFIMKKGFDGIPVSVLEAAELDGAGAITTYIRIGLPLGIPGILSALLLSFIEAWNAIEQPLVFLKSQNLWPMSLFLANITQDDIGIAMVASVFMLLPVILIFLFGQRYLILGIQSSGVKE